MEATINALCYKSKKLKNGEHPIMLRVCFDGKKNYISLGVSVKAENWDFQRNCPMRKCPNRKEIQDLIAQKVKYLQETELKVKLRGKPYTGKSIIEYQQDRPILTVGELFEKYIAELNQEGRRGYMLSVKTVYSSLKKFRSLDIFFPEIDINWLKGYELWLRNQHLSENTIGIRFRTLRTLYNLAIDRNFTRADFYPFKSFKLARLRKETIKRAITKANIQKIERYIPKTEYEQLAIDVFMFSYYEGGINFVDIAHLKQDNIYDNMLAYYRNKTKKLIKVPLQIKAIQIIQRNQNSSSKYLFPILSKFHKTDEQRANRVHKVITKVNRDLNQIGKELGFTLKLTTYVARHTQATVMKKAGVPTSIISQIMGHSSEKVTQVYLDSFENEQINDAMKHL